MPRPSKLDSDVVDRWLLNHEGWALGAISGGLVRTFKLPDFATALAFAVRLGMLAEKKDHHPDILIGWGKAEVKWTTHDAAGITQLDLDLAEATDALAGS
jgi:4a-hydroxytetrahydrobiopterin dehydratase